MGNFQFSDSMVAKMKKHGIQELELIVWIMPRLPRIDRVPFATVTLTTLPQRNDVYSFGPLKFGVDACGGLHYPLIFSLSDKQEVVQGFVSTTLFTLFELGKKKEVLPVFDYRNIPNPLFAVLGYVD
jgi:hypothetical protein